MTINKYEHVKRARQTRYHTCHWPKCNKQVPPAMWGCKTHWFQIPHHLRQKIWQTYKASQEIRMDPSSEYCAVAREVEKWIEENY